MILGITALLLALIGGTLGIGGAWLVMLGGSWYYLIAGLGFLITAGLLLRRSPAAIAVYALVLVATLAWAIWEAGFDWWQLVPRGGIVLLLALWLLTPLVRNRFEPPASATPLDIAVLLALVAAGYAAFTDPKDLAGRLPTEKAGARRRPGAGRGMALRRRQRAWPALLVPRSDHTGERR